MAQGTSKYSHSQHGRAGDLRILCYSSFPPLSFPHATIRLGLRTRRRGGFRWGMSGLRVRHRWRVARWEPCRSLWRGVRVDWLRSARGWRDPTRESRHENPDTLNPAPGRPTHENPDTLNPAHFWSWSPRVPTGGGLGPPWSSDANRVGWGCRKATRRRGQSLRGRGGQRGISRWSAHGPHQEGLLHGRLCTSQTAGR